MATYGEDGRNVKAAYKRFFRSLPLAAATRTKIFFSHSIPEAEFVDQYDRDFFETDFETLYKSRRRLVEELVWGRDFSNEVASTYVEGVGAHVVMIGHEPCADGHGAPNDHTVILDCKDDNACYCLLRLNQPYSQKGILGKIRKLH